jgi:hypothetical protein
MVVMASRVATRRPSDDRILLKMTDRLAVGWTQQGKVRYLEAGYKWKEMSDTTAGFDNAPLVKA